MHESITVEAGLPPSTTAPRAGSRTSRRLPGRRRRLRPLPARRAVGARGGEGHRRRRARARRGEAGHRDAEERAPQGGRAAAAAVRRRAAAAASTAAGLRAATAAATPVALRRRPRPREAASLFIVGRRARGVVPRRARRRPRRAAGGDQKAYAKLALRFHPDRCTSPGATAAMARINEAYEQAMLQAKARYR